jgi:hypothetical protein
VNGYAKEAGGGCDRIPRSSPPATGLGRGPLQPCPRLRPIGLRDHAIAANAQFFKSGLRDANTHNDVAWSLYVVIADGVARQAGRWEARPVETVEADSREEAERLARTRWPGLRLTVSTPSRPHSSPPGLVTPNTD